MKMVFENIDGRYSKSRPEYMGDIQPKFWFIGQDENILVKRQHSQKVNGQQQKSKMFNHFGEYFGYLLADKSGVQACPVRLITVHDFKNKYSTTKHLYTACGSKRLLKLSQSMILGESIVSAFMHKHANKYNEIISKIECSPELRSYMQVEKEDNIDVIILSIITQTIDFERQAEMRSTEEIESDVKENLKNAFDMVVYDCLFGNDDRHSQNWAMCSDLETGRIQMYPLYDNERVLGLSKPEAEIKRYVHSENVSDITDKKSLSRMGISPVHSGLPYMVMLNHIVKNYPEYAIPSIKKITDQITEQDIENLYNATIGITTRSQDADELTEKDELPMEYKIYGTELYSKRRSYARELLLRSKENKNKQEQEDIILI